MSRSGLAGGDMAGGDVKDGRRFHEASEAEAERLWRAVVAARLFETREAFDAWRACAPWAIRINASGEAVLLEPWRDQLDIVHVRAAWCRPQGVADMLADVRTVADEHGLRRLLSPMLDERSVRPYVDAGLTARLRLIAYAWKPPKLQTLSPARGLVVRDAHERDVDGVTALEEACFTEFWRHGQLEIARQLRAGRMVVAQEGGEVIGYTLTTLRRGSATLARIAVSPDARRRGVGATLLSEASDFAERAGALTMSLCTQETNHASRALYRSFGLAELADRMVLVADPGVSF